MAVTLQQIAERAGVSRGTVDRALNNRGRIRPEVADRIRSIAEEMGYKPNRAGKALALAKRSFCIGVILQEMETMFMEGIRLGVREATQELEHLGAEVILKEVRGVNTKAVLAAMEELREANVHGIALNPPQNRRTREAIEKFVTEYQIPVVTFNTDLTDCRRLCYIGQNTYECGRAAGGLMGEITGGRGAVAVITGYESNPSLSNRVAGFEAELEARFPEMEVVDKRYVYNSNAIAQDVTQELLELYPELIGLFLTVNVEEGVCAALEKVDRLGKVKIIGNDLNRVNRKRLESGDLSFVLEQNAKVQGYEPVMVLFRLLFDGEPPRCEYQYTDLTIRTRYNLPPMPE